MSRLRPRSSESQPGPVPVPSHTRLVEKPQHCMQSKLKQIKRKDGDNITSNSKRELAAGNSKQQCNESKLAASNPKRKCNESKLAASNSKRKCNESELAASNSNRQYNETELASKAESYTHGNDEETYAQNEEFCNSCGRSPDEPNLLYFQGHPQNSVAESEVEAEQRLEFGVGADELPLCNITGFSIYDREGHMCPLDGNLIENGVEIFISGYLKSFDNYSPDIDEEQVPVKDVGPISEWWLQSDDDYEGNQIRITTDLREYNLISPSDSYQNVMMDLYEKITICKLVISYLTEKGELEPSYSNLVKVITKHVIPQAKSKRITEQMIIKHSKFIFDEVSIFEDEDDELNLTQLPCMRELFKICMNHHFDQDVNKKQIFKKKNGTIDHFNPYKEQPTKATTTPLVRTTFESLFQDQLDGVVNDVTPKKLCGLCDSCLQPNCGECTSCKNMAKFGGASNSSDMCHQRNCMAGQTGENEEDECIEYEDNFYFAEVESKVINWPEIPVNVQDNASYFKNVYIDGTQYKKGDYVMIKTQADNVPCLVGRIVYIYRDNKAPKSGYFHGELFMRSSDTILGEVGHPKEVFMSDHCYHGIPLSSIMKKAKVEKKYMREDWFTSGGEMVIQEADVDDGNSFYYQKYYDRFTARFVDLPEDLVCNNNKMKHSFCSSCERKTEMDFKEIPRLRGKINENTVNIHEVKMSEWSSVRWRDLDFNIGRPVFLRPDAVKLPNNYNKRQTEHTLKPCHDENLYPEYYRKKISSINVNGTVRRAFAIGVIISITSEGWGAMVDPHKIVLKVRIMYRPENTNCRTPQYEDLNIVFWSEHVEEIPFMSVVGPCELYYENNIPFPRLQWLEEDTNRFYFKKAYDHKKEKVVAVPKEALLVGKEYGKKKSSKEKSAKCEKIKPLRTLDAFAGCGGLSEGLHQVGIADCRWAIENDESAAESFKANNPNCTVIVKDCNTVLKDIIAGRNNERLPNKGDVEFLCGGPPCQGYSGINRFSSGEYSAFKNSLVVTHLSYCDYYRPKYFLLENVRNFVAFRKGLLVKLTLRVLLDMGYQCTFTVLQAGGYGIPQTRIRLIILASAPGYKLPLYPEPINTFNRIGCRLSTRIDGKLFKSNINTFRSAPRRTITIFDALSDLSEIENGAHEQDINYVSDPLTHFQRMVRSNSKNVVTDHVCKKMSTLAHERIKLIPKVPGADWRDLPNIEITLPDGTVIQKLQYTHDDKKQGRSKKGSLRGVCRCASGLPCNKKEKDKSDSTIIPWGMAHTANRNNNWSGIYGRLSWYNYFRTTITDPEPSGKQGRVLHPDQHRVVSVRECARSQGFSDSFRLCGTIADKYRQIGNAVPPPMAAAIGREIKKALAATKRQ